MDVYAARELDRPLPSALIEANYPPSSFSVEDIWGALLRRRRLIVGVFLAVFAVGALVTLLRPVKFESTALLLVNPREPQGVVAQPQQGANVSAPDSGYVDSQVEILNSSAAAQQLADRLHLERDREFATGGDRADMLRRVADAINAKRRGSTYVVEVDVTSKDPRKSALMANTLVDIYLASRANARIADANQHSVWLASRLQQMRGELEQREAAAENFRAQAGIVTVNGVPLTETQLQESENALVAARVDEAQRAARARQGDLLVANGAAGASGGLTSDVMVALRAREADVDRRLAEYADRYGDQHPVMLAARAEKQDIERQISAEVSRLSHSLHDDARVAQAGTATLQGHVASVRRDLLRENQQSVQLAALERDATAARTVYDNFMQRYNELANGSAGVGNDAELVARATPPDRPQSRGVPLMMILSAVLGGLAGVFCAFIAERMSTRVQTVEEIEKKAGLPILSSVPRLKGSELNAAAPLETAPSGYLVARPRSAFAEAFRLLRLRILRNKGGRLVRTVSVLSPLPGEGKTSTSLCLARMSAMSGLRVMLIDCDLRGRALNAALGIEPSKGIVEVLRGQMNWLDVTGADDASGAHVIAAAGDCFTSEDLFNSPRFAGLLNELSSRYDLVVLDCPPVLTIAESRDIAAQTDASVLVARRGRTSLSSLRTTMRELDDIGATVIGGVFNAVDPNAPGLSSYADPLYFSHGQRSAYTT